MRYGVGHSVSFIDVMYEWRKGEENSVAAPSATENNNEVQRKRLVRIFTPVGLHITPVYRNQNKILLMRKVLLITLLLFGAVVGVQGQGYERVPLKQRGMLRLQRVSNFTATIGVGVHEMMANGNIFNPTVPGIGGHLELGYTHLFTSFWGIHAALGVTYGGSTVKFDELETKGMGEMPVFGNDGSEKRLSHVITYSANAREDYSVTYLTLPVMALYQKDHFFMEAGVRLLFPVSASAKYEYGEAMLSFGEEVDGMGVTLPMPIEYRKIPARDGKYDVESNWLTVAAALEVGYRYAVSNENHLMVSFFVDFGLNSIKGSGDGSMVELVDKELKYNHCLESSAISSLRYLSMGVRLKYDLNFGDRLQWVNPYKITGLRDKWL